MTRPRAYTIAAVLMLLYNLISVVDTLPALAGGAAAVATDGPPFVLTVANFVALILGFVAAYGVWRVERWGVVLAIVVCVVQVLTGLPAVLFAPPVELRLFAGFGIVWSAAIIVLLLRPGSRPTAA